MLLTLLPGELSRLFDLCLREESPQKDDLEDLDLLDFPDRIDLVSSLTGLTVVVSAFSSASGSGSGALTLFFPVQSLFATILCTIHSGSQLLW